MSDDFLIKVSEALKGAGFESKFDGVYLVVAECKFDAERGGKEGRVKFLGSSFKVSEAGDFDVGKACGLVVQELPARLKEKESMERAVKFRAELREHVKGGSPVMEHGYKDWYPVEGGWLSVGPGGIELKTVHPSVEEALACLGRLMP